MCGTALLGQPTSVPPAATVGAREQRKAAPVPAPPPAEQRMPGRFASEPERPAESPVITGPSFLGLNKPADPARGSFSEPGRSNYPDSLGRPSGNLDYLLEDVEEESKSGWGKVLVFLIALALVGGFGYLRWKQGGFDWVMGPRKTVTDTTSGTDSANAPAAATPPPAANSNAQASPPAATNNPSSGSNTSTSAPASQNTTPTTGGTDTASAPSPTTNAAPPQASSDNAMPAKPQADSSASDKTAATDSADNSPDSASDSDTSPAPAPARSVVKPQRERKPSPATPVDATAEADRYIYGRGVPQDCDRGLRMLKVAAQSNPNAMVELGALYSAGNCAPRDLPTAYRWFAQALHKQPDNQRLQDDLQKLWGQMTPPERQLAIKLSQ
jgi:hypothetical protein